MSKIRNTAVAVLAGVAVSLGAIAVPADAATDRGTVTRTEYRKIKHGMTVEKVERVTHARGKVTSAMSMFGKRYVTREFKTESRYGFVTVDFEARRGQPLRMTSKLAYFG